MVLGAALFFAVIWQLGLLESGPGPQTNREAPADPKISKKASLPNLSVGIANPSAAMRMEAHTIASESLAPSSRLPK